MKLEEADFYFNVSLVLAALLLILVVGILMYSFRLLVGVIKDFVKHLVFTGLVYLIYTKGNQVDSAAIVKSLMKILQTLASYVVPPASV